MSKKVNNANIHTNIAAKDETTLRWIRQTAREGMFRVTKEMAEAFKQLVALCIADLSATTAHEQEVIAAQMYGKKLIIMAYEMPVHTTDLNISGKELGEIVPKQTDLAEIMQLLLLRVQDGELTNEQSILRKAVQAWHERSRHKKR